MWSRQRKIQAIVIVGLVFGGITASPSRARPHDPDGGRPTNPPGAMVNQHMEVRPDLGMQQPDLTPGVNGYKVFNPGAIAWMSAQPEGNSGDVTGASIECSPCRRGNTDAFNQTFGGVDGQHSSNSDLLEDQIRVDGTIQKTNEPILDDCADPKTGHFANCGTYGNSGSGTYVAKSYHYFRKSGYTDSTLNTADSQVR